MVFSTPNQKCRDVIIGHSLQALLCSYLNDTPIIVNKKPSNTLLDFCDPSLPLYLVGLENKLITLKTNENFVEFGSPKSELRSNLLLCISMSGLLLNSILPWSIKIQDNKIEYFTKARKNSIIFDSLRIFDCDNIEGLNIKKHDISYEVYDSIHIRSSNKNHVEYIKTKDNFVKKFIYTPAIEMVHSPRS